MHIVHKHTHLALNRPAFLVGTRKSQKFGGRCNFFPWKDQRLFEVGKRYFKGGRVCPQAFNATHGSWRFGYRLGGVFGFSLFVFGSKGKIPGKDEQEFPFLFFEIGDDTGGSSHLNVVPATGMPQQRTGPQGRGFGRKRGWMRGHGPIGGKLSYWFGWLFAIGQTQCLLFGLRFGRFPFGSDLFLGGRR